MTVRELREKYLAFFISKGHRAFPSGSLIPYDVTGRLDTSLLFNGAGMIQFKPYFRGIAKPEHPRLTTCQKCVRTGDIDEVGDDTHLTFFEMLGNFSFGDYFREEAIRFSWEFLTSPEWLGLDPARLSFTVFEEDDEAVAIWQSCGAHHVVRLGEETNYWPAGSFSKGPPGPCGPNSEMFYWVGDGPPPAAGQSREDWLADDAAGNWVEIWNDVFIQYEWQGEALEKGYRKTGMPDLPFRSIDTGMGLERTAMVLGGQSTVYETDAFTAIFAAIDRLSGTVEGPTTVARRVIADHIRTATFCIADGILPSNTGRGYVLRRLIRRAVLKGDRALGITDTFLYRVFDGVIEAMGHAYPELEEQRSVIVETLKNEEEAFRRTLSRGVEEFLQTLRVDQVRIARAQGESILHFGPTNFIGTPSDYKRLVTDQSRMKVFPGHIAFNLYSTFGFPVEITSELAEEAGLRVDMADYEESLKADQELARGAQGEKSAYGGLTNEDFETRAVDNFLQVYDPYSAQSSIPGTPEISSRIIAIRRVIAGRGDDSIDRVFELAITPHPFYFKAGGQESDLGELTMAENPEALQVQGWTKDADGIYWITCYGITDFNDLRSIEAQKMAGVSFSTSEQIAPVSPQFDHLFTGSDAEVADKLGRKFLGQTVLARVDADRRNRTQPHHTGTHLLHLALREALGAHATQAGSYVGPDRLRFDFTHGAALTPEQREQIERRVNELAQANFDVVTHVDISPEEAKSRGAMALFGEKYGNKVRMVEVGPSKELCGGTHVRTSAEVLPFRILAEASAASGIRRIEAVAGPAARELAQQERAQLATLAHTLKTVPHELSTVVDKLLGQLKEERQKREAIERKLIAGGTDSAVTTVSVGPVSLKVQNFGEMDAKVATSAIDDAVAANPLLVFVGAVLNGDKVAFTAKAGAEAVKHGVHAGKLVGEVARIAGGGGGGRPDFATAGGKDASQSEAALAIAESVLRGQIK